MDNITGSQTNPLDNPNLCIIAQGMREKGNEPPVETARKILEALRQDNAGNNISSAVRITGAMRHNNINPRRPALLKFAVENLEQKKEHTVK